ncbi:hypothetical protein EVA_20977 [gut metagenome]|uniref:Uncharacterized protein n=1 Tax=gut metagenome TaxID=749906 RepID=J9FMT6_9ZZZZ
MKTQTNELEDYLNGWRTEARWIGIAPPPAPKKVQSV